MPAAGHSAAPHFLYIYGVPGSRRSHLIRLTFHSTFPFNLPKSNDKEQALEGLVK